MIREGIMIVLLLIYGGICIVLFGILYVYEKIMGWFKEWGLIERIEKA